MVVAVIVSVCLCLPLALFLGLCAEPLSVHCLGVDLDTAQAVGMFCKGLVPGLVPAALTMVRVMMNNPADLLLLLLQPCCLLLLLLFDVSTLAVHCFLSPCFLLLAAAACLLAACLLRACCFCLSLPPNRRR